MMLLGWALLAYLASSATPAAAAVPACVSGGNNGAVKAEVVAMDQVITYNRMGAFAPAGMIFALARDVFPKGTPAVDQTFDNSCAGSGACSAGNVQLRDDKRPRPLTLRVNEGCEITVTLTNLLMPAAPPVTIADPVVADAQNEAPGINLCEPPPAFQQIGSEVTPRGSDLTPPSALCESEQPATRNVGIHIHGMIPATMADDGSNVGNNGSSLVAPGDTGTYTVTAGREGAYVITSGPNLGGEGGSGAIASGLFGVLNVEPAGSTWYRSQVTQADMLLAIDMGKTFDCDGVAENGSETVGYTCGGHPVLNYDALYPAGHPYFGKPILRILDGDAVFHNVLDAVIDDRQMHGLYNYEL